MMRKTCFLGAMVALMVTPLWGSLQADFNLDHEIRAIQGAFLQNSERRYINIKVNTGRESLIKALRAKPEDPPVQKSFHGRDFTVIGHRGVSETVLGLLDDEPIFNKSTPKDFPEPGQSFWSVYCVEAPIDKERDKEGQENNEALYTRDDVLEPTFVEVVPQSRAGYYFAVQYREILKDILEMKTQEPSVIQAPPVQMPSQMPQLAFEEDGESFQTTLSAIEEDEERPQASSTPILQQTSGGFFAQFYAGLTRILRWFKSCFQGW